MDTDGALKSLSALSHESRLAAFRQLVQAGPEGLSVGELRDLLGLPPATVSAHLNGLRQAGRAQDQRDRVRAGYWQMEALPGYLSENCCAGANRCSPVSTCQPKPTGDKK